MDEFDMHVDFAKRLDFSAIPIDLVGDYQAYDEDAAWASGNAPEADEIDIDDHAAGTGTGAGGGVGGADGAHKAYHTKRPHKKSRRGVSLDP
jgi:hypothetical protein